MPRFLSPPPPPPSKKDKGKGGKKRRVPSAKWCFENSCGVLHSYPYHIVFKDEAEVAWFLLRWS